MIAILSYSMIGYTMITNLTNSAIVVLIYIIIARCRKVRELIVIIDHCQRAVAPMKNTYSDHVSILSTWPMRG